MTAGPPPWTLLRERPGARLVQCGPLVCVHYRSGESTADDLHADFDAEDRVVAEFGQISQLVVFGPDWVHGVAGERREALTERLRKWGSKHRRTGIVLLQSGVAAAMRRTAVMNVTTMSSTTEQHAFFASAREALRWVQQVDEPHPLVLAAELEPLARDFGVPLF